MDLAYLKQVAIAADSLGYEGVLIPTGASCEDSWLVAAALAPMTTRLREYMAVGADRFILSGYPHLEEAHRFAELVMPLLPSASRPVRAGGRVNTGPFGGAIANDATPTAVAAQS